MNSQLELLQTLRTAVFNQLITSNPDLNIAILLLDNAFQYRFLLSNSKEAREARVHHKAQQLALNQHEKLS